MKNLSRKMMTKSNSVSKIKIRAEKTEVPLYLQSQTIFSLKECPATEVLTRMIVMMKV